MPKTQTGSVVKRSKRNYGVRFYDEEGVRRYQGGFETQTAAESWLRTKVDEALALRRGDLIPARDRPKTVDELVDASLTRCRRGSTRRSSSPLREAATST